jgi:hypothetical protein
MTLKPSNCRPGAGSDRAPNNVSAPIANATANANETIERTR